MKQTYTQAIEDALEQVDQLRKIAEEVELKEPSSIIRTTCLSTLAMVTKRLNLLLSNYQPMK
jgi:hypothetical protein